MSVVSADEVDEVSYPTCGVAMRVTLRIFGKMAFSKGVFTLALHACLYEGQGWVGGWEGGPANDLWTYGSKISPGNIVYPCNFGQNSHFRARQSLLGVLLAAAKFFLGLPNPKMGGLGLGFGLEAPGVPGPRSKVFRHGYATQTHTHTLSLSHTHSVVKKSRSRQ